MRVFLDLDGTVVDFITPAMELNGVPPHISANYPKVGWDVVKACNTLRDQLGLPPVNVHDFWRNVNSSVFWSGLKPYPGALDFVDWLTSKFDVYISTSPSSSPHSSWGKHAWVYEKLPRLKRKLFIGSQKHLLAGRGRLLIDDSDENCNKFQDWGGKSLLVPRPWNSCGGWGDFKTVKRMINALDFRC